MPSLPLPTPSFRAPSYQCFDASNPTMPPVNVVPNYTAGTVLAGIVTVAIAQLDDLADAMDSLSTLDTDATSEPDRIQVDGVDAFPPVSVAAIQTADVVTGLQLAAGPAWSRGTTASVAGAFREIAAAV